MCCLPLLVVLCLSVCFGDLTVLIAVAVSCLCFSVQLMSVALMYRVLRHTGSDLVLPEALSTCLLLSHFCSVHKAKPVTRFSISSAMYPVVLKLCCFVMCTAWQAAACHWETWNS